MRTQCRHLSNLLLSPVIGSLIISACQPINSGIDQKIPIVSTQTKLIDPLSVNPTYESSAPLAEETLTPLVTQPPTDSEPLRFTFPTPGAEPISLWRPPLYEAPWALGPFDHFYFVRPIAADEVNWPLADYRYGGIFPGTDIVHTGIDIPVPRGTPVLAAGPGKVIRADYMVYSTAKTPLMTPMD